jgi:hypothetical protein
MSPKLSWLLASSAIIDVLPAGRMKENTVLISDVLIQKQHNQTVEQNPIDFLLTQISQRIFPPPVAPSTSFFSLHLLVINQRTRVSFYGLLTSIIT